MAVEGDEPMEQSVEDKVIVAEESPAAKPWYRKPAILAVLALVVAGGIAAIVVPRISEDRAKDAGSSEMVDGRYKTLQDYLKDNGITTTPIRRGDPGTPTITLGLPPNWADSGPDTPEWAYAEAFMKDSSNPDDPGYVDVLLSKLSGDVDQAALLQYAPGELRNLPNYQPVSGPGESTLSDFDAVQLAGLYTRDGQERVIAQKTVVIPTGDGLYVLQINADAPKADAQAIQQATVVLDDRAQIVP